MATLHVRNVPDALYEALRERAEREGRSIGSEAIVLLEEALSARSAVGALLGRRRRVRPGAAAPFERFSAEARGALAGARHEASSLGHAYLGTEHLLLGVLRETDLVPALPLDAARRAVERIVGCGEIEPPSQPPFTPRAKRALELAVREALAAGAEQVMPHHLLIAIADDGEGVAAKILAEAGIDAPSLRAMPIADDGAGYTFEQGGRYRAVALRGGADEWTEQLNALAGEGWELFSVAAEGREQRAVFVRR